MFPAPVITIEYSEYLHLKARSDKEYNYRLHITKTKHYCHQSYYQHDFNSFPFSFPEYDTIEVTKFPNNEQLTPQVNEFIGSLISIQKSNEETLKQINEIVKTWTIENESLKETHLHTRWFHDCILSRLEKIPNCLRYFFGLSDKKISLFRKHFLI